METQTKLLIEDKQPRNISGCQPGVREHLSHGILEFNPEMFEVLPASHFGEGTLREVRKAVFAAGRIPANATVLDFILENKTAPEVESFINPFKEKDDYPMFLYFLGTTYRSLSYNCSGDVRILSCNKQYGWTGTIPHCLDVDTVCEIHYVVLLK